MAVCDIDLIENAGDWSANAHDVIEKAVLKVWDETEEGKPLGRPAEISVILTDNAEVQELNRDWRGKDKPTNVLSFAAEEGDDPDWAGMPAEMKAEMPRMLGDIVLAYETVLQEAASQGKIFEHHLTHLVMHGVLHLLGYDHIEEDEAEIMEALETKYLADFNISDPYLAGASAPDFDN